MNHHSLSSKIAYLCGAVIFGTTSFCFNLLLLFRPNFKHFKIFPSSPFCILFSLWLILKLSIISSGNKDHPAHPLPWKLQPLTWKTFFGQFLGVVVTVIQGSNARDAGGFWSWGWVTRVCARWGRLLLRNCCQWKQNKLGDRHVCLSVGTAATQKT